MSSRASITHPTRRLTGTGSRLLTAALGAVGLGVVAALFTAQLQSLWPDVVATATSWNVPTGAGITTMAAPPFLALGALMAAWWSLSLLLITASLAAELAGVRSVALARCIQAVAPRALRGLAVAGIGAGLTLASLPAHAADDIPDLGWTTTQPATTPQPSLSPEPGSGSGPAPSSQAAARDASPADAGDRAVAAETDSDRDGPPSAAPDTGGHSTAETTDPTSLSDPVPLGVAGAGAGAGGNGSGASRTPAPAEDTPSGAPSAQPVPTSAVPISPPPSALPAGHPSPTPTDQGGLARHLVPTGGAHDTPGPSGSAEPVVQESAGTVVVVPGDSLWRLAAATLPAGATNAQIASSWKDWYEANVSVIGADPDLLLPGQVLRVPTPTG